MVLMPSLKCKSLAPIAGTFKSYPYFTTEKPNYTEAMFSKPKKVMILSCYLLVSPPLHLSLVIADIISFLAFNQVRNTAELLVVVHELVFSTNTVHSIFG